MPEKVEALLTAAQLQRPRLVGMQLQLQSLEAILITVKFDAKLGDEKKPDLTIKGTLEVSCPRKK